MKSGISQDTVSMKLQALTRKPCCVRAVFDVCSSEDSSRSIFNRLNVSVQINQVQHANTWTHQGQGSICKKDVRLFGA